MGDYEKWLQIQSEHKAFIEELKTKLIKRSELSVLFNGDVDLISKHSTRYRALYLRLSDDSTLWELTQNPNYSQIIDILFPFEMFVKNNQIDNWVRYIRIAFENKNRYLLEFLLMKFFDYITAKETKMQIKWRKNSMVHIKEVLFNALLEVAFFYLSRIPEFLSTFFKGDVELLLAFKDVVEKYTAQEYVPHYRRSIALQIFNNLSQEN